MKKIGESRLLKLFPVFLLEVANLRFVAAPLFFHLIKSGLVLALQETSEINRCKDLWVLGCLLQENLEVVFPFGDVVFVETALDSFNRQRWDVAPRILLDKRVSEPHKVVEAPSDDVVERFCPDLVCNKVF